MDAFETNSVESEAIAGVNEQLAGQEQKTSKKKSPSYFVIYKDGDVQGDLTKADAQKILEDDDNSGEIKMLLRGTQVDYSVKKVASATID